MAPSAVLLRACVAHLVAGALSFRGLRRGSLSGSGAVAAFAVGCVSLCASYRFGTTLYAFYLSCTRVTRFRADRKRHIEQDHRPLGARSAKQVLCSSLPAVCVAVYYAGVYGHDVLVSRDTRPQAVLLLMYLLFFAACAGDTFASEVGIVSQHPPRLLLMPWRTVPRGTNGAVTPLGLAMSAVGGAVVGIVFWLTGPTRARAQILLVPIAAAAGLLGSALDSVLGMMLEATWVDRKTGKVVKAPRDSEANAFQYVCGRDWISGEMVNLLSAVLTMMLAPPLVACFE